MLHQKDGPKRHGRFVKRDSRLAKTVQVIDYSFEEIRQAPVIGTDNSFRTIIHQKLHHPEEVETSILDPVNLNMDLIDRTLLPPIIMPADFTKDWQQEHQNRKRRIAGFDDEDDYDFTTQNRIAENETEQANAVAEGLNTAEQPNNSEDQPNAVESSTTAQEKNIDPPALTQFQKLDLVSKEMKEIFQKDKVDAPPAAQDSFVPLVSSIQNSESEAAPPQQLSENEREALIAEARKEGYAQGIAQGAAEGQKQTQEAATILQDMTRELSHMKRSILESIEKNFYEISLALGETLLQREFTLKPELFPEFMRKAIQETVKNDQFKIRLHPSTADLLKKLNTADLDVHFAIDQNIPPGQFKIESDLSVVDVNARGVIKSLLDQMDLALFDEQNPATMKKAG